MATRRPDLEAMAYKAPPYVAASLFPPFLVNQKNGIMQYADVLADLSAQTGRSLAAAPTTTTVVSAQDAFTAAEVIRRVNAGDSEMLLFGGKELWQARAARIVKRSVGASIETAAATATFGGIAGISHSDIGNNAIAGIDRAVERISDFAEGKTCLFGARRTLNRLKRYAEVVERMQFTGIMPSSVRDVRGVSDEQLAAALGVDVVVGGPAAPWFTGGSGAYGTYLGVAILPDPSVHPVEEVQLGRTTVYAVGGQDPDNIFMVEEYYDNNLIAEVVQARAWYQIQLLNKEALYILTGFDEDNAVTSTSTTTTY